MEVCVSEQTKRKWNDGKGNRGRGNVHSPTLLEQLCPFLQQMIPQVRDEVRDVRRFPLPFSYY